MTTYSNKSGLHTYIARLSLCMIKKNLLTTENIARSHFITRGSEGKQFFRTLNDDLVNIHII